MACVTMEATSGGNVKPVLTLLYSGAYASSSQRTITLSEDIDKFDFLIFSFKEFTNNVCVPITNDAILAITTPENFKKSQITGTFTGGSSGSMTTYTDILTYVTNTTITEKRNVAGARTLYVYGIRNE